VKHRAGAVVGGLQRSKKVKQQERKMALIGTLTATKDGGWEGTIQTLTINTKVRFVPNDNKSNERAPAFRILAGRSEVGAAWRKRSAGDIPRDYLSIELDDPSLAEPMSAAGFPASDGKEAQIVWSRPKEGDRDGQ
jgi:uncharacterized protein (DUF736 family)